MHFWVEWFYCCIKLYDNYRRGPNLCSTKPPNEQKLLIVRLAIGERKYPSSLVIAVFISGPLR